MEERLINLEMKVSHQDVIIEDLHQVVYQQQLLIERLLKKIEPIEALLKSENEIRGPGEKPPHY